MITLTSDFGLKDPYVAEMKGVILGINPNATLIDVTHEIQKFNVRIGAFVLAAVAPYFPKGTIHLAVIDPGVGTERRAIVIQTKEGYFVGPDNGVLVLAAKQQSIEHIYELANPEYMRSEVSSTFHGRDIFAPAAAHLDKGVDPSAFGPRVTDAIKPEFVSVKQSNGSFLGEVLHIDSFGNIITNINQTLVPTAEKAIVQTPATRIEIKVAKTYAQAKIGELIALIGSHGFMEIVLNQASAAEKLHAKVGDKIAVSFA